MYNMRYVLLVILVCLIALGGFLFLRDTGTLPTRPVTLVAFGDSLTEGYGVGPADNYPALLQNRLQKTPPLSVRVLNKGVSGNTTRDAIARVSDVVQAKPDVVIIGIGGNDILRKIPVTETRKNIITLVETLQRQTQARIILLEIDVPLRGEYNDIYHDVADTYDIELVPFFYPSLALSNTYAQNDRIHLTKAGYEKVVDEHIYPAVIATLKQL